MKFLIRTIAATVFTLIILAVAAYRYTDIDKSEDAAAINIDRQQISDDLAAVSASADKFNDFLGSAINRIKDQL